MGARPIGGSGAWGTVRRWLRASTASIVVPAAHPVGAPPPPSSLPRQRCSGHGGNLLTHVVLQQDRVAPFSLKWLDLAEALLLVIDLVVQRPDPLTTFLLVENPVVQQPDLCGNTPPGGESGGGLAESCSAAPPGGGSARSSGGAAVMDGLVVGLRNGLTSSQ